MQLCWHKLLHIAVYEQGFQAIEDADAAHTSTDLQVAADFATRNTTDHLQEAELGHSAGVALESA